jgi:tetratricopeptide (TPR) repeat protein
MATVNELYQEVEKLKNAQDLEGTVAKCNEILAIDPNHLLTHVTLAVVLGRLGRHEEAVRHAETAVKIDPTDAFNFTALSVTYQRAYAGTGNMAYIRMAEDARDRAQMVQGGHRHHH